MKKKFNVQNLDCAHCAAKLEDAINKLDIILECTVNFATSTMTIETNAPMDKVMPQVQKVIKKTEPDVIISEAKTKKEHKKITFKQIYPLILFGLGVAIGVIVYAVPMTTWLYWTLLVASILLIGYKTYFKAVVLLFRGTIDENLLVTISVIGAIALGEHDEGIMVVGLYTLGKILEGYAVNRSRNSVKDLMQLQPEYAIIVDGNEERKVDPNEVKIGSTIVVRPGERVPLDGKIIRGEGSIDTKNLTGESIPRYLKTGENILSGSIVIDGLLYIETTGLYEHSTVSRIMTLIEDASDKKSKTETFISKFARYYTLIVVACAVIVFSLTWAILGNYSTAIYRGLIFLVVACPCAFAISVPLAYFSGLGNASKYGILIKGSNYLDVINRVDTMVFDKTGTLTTGLFGVDKIESHSDKYSEEDILRFACLGEQHSIHPIARAIMHAGENVELVDVEDFKEVAGKGISYFLNNKTYFVGRTNAKVISTAVDIKENNKKIGTIYLSDRIKPESYDMIQYLKAHGVKTVMLSGDNEAVTQDVATKLGVDEYHSGMLPQEKYKWLQDKINSETKSKTSFVGDGINDAPSLSLADVGISMGLAGSPATVEASDIVIVDDKPDKVVKAMKLGKYNKRIVLENIIFACVTKVAVLVLGAIGITNMLIAVFADVGVTLLATLNSIRALYHRLDKKPKHIK